MSSHIKRINKKRICKTKGCEKILCRVNKFGYCVGCSMGMRVKARWAEINKRGKNNGKKRHNLL